MAGGLAGRDGLPTTRKPSAPAAPSWFSNPTLRRAVAREGGLCVRLYRLISTEPTNRGPGRSRALPDPMPKKRESDATGTLKKLSRILDQFDLEHPVRSLAELTRLSGLPKTSVFRVVKVGVECDLLSAGPDGYRLSLRLFELGMIAREGFSFRDHLNRSVEALAEKLGETDLAATVDGKQLLYLAVAEPRRERRVAARAGFRR